MSKCAEKSKQSSNGVLQNQKYKLHATRGNADSLPDEVEEFHAVAQNA